MQLRKPTKTELVLFHDLYFETSEPDAPKAPFASLSEAEKEQALRHYNPENHFTVLHGDKLVGFAGLYPDDEQVDVNVFYIVVPAFRGQGYLSKILTLLRHQCQEHYPDYHYLRALTQKKNVPSLRALMRASFVRVGEYTEEDHPEVLYEDYVLEIHPQK